MTDDRLPVPTPEDLEALGDALEAAVNGRASPHQLDLTLPRDLHEATEFSRLLALLRERVGLTQLTIATATGVTIKAVRNWELHHAHPHQRRHDQIVYLAEVVSVLAGTLTHAGIRQWLLSRHADLGDTRPIDWIAAGDLRVVRAAHFLAGDPLA